MQVFKNIFTQQTKLESLQFVLLLTLIFSVPISSAAPNVLGFALIVSLLFQRNYLENWMALKNNRLFWAFTAYFLIYPISLLWSENVDWGLHVVERHLIFLLFPVILLTAKRGFLPYYVAAFIAGMTFAEITSYLIWFNIISIVGVDPHDPTPFYGHVAYNPMLAWALYIVLHSLVFEQRSWAQKAFYAVFSLTMTINMFITGGRGGQLAFFVVVGVLILQFFTKKGQMLKGVVLGCSLILSTFVIAYQTSFIFQSRVDLAIKEVQNYSASSQSSVGSRLSFYQNSLKLAFNRPLDQILFGSGVGDLPEDYSNSLSTNSSVRLYASEDSGYHTHPHNQYLYELVALGLFGVGVFFMMFWMLFQRYRLVSDEYKDHRLAFLFFMGTIMLTDSLLLAHGTALLFIVFSAVLFGMSEKDVNTYRLL